MSVQDIIDFAKKNQCQLTVSVNPNSDTLLIEVFKNGEKQFRVTRIETLENAANWYAREILADIALD